jgi:hypothetical protein
LGSAASFLPLATISDLTSRSLENLVRNCFILAPERGPLRLPAFARFAFPLGAALSRFAPSDEDIESIMRF